MANSPAVPAHETLVHRAWSFFKLWARNTVGLFPLIGLMAFGILVSTPAVIFSRNGLGMRISNALFRHWGRVTLRTFGVRVWAMGLENLNEGPAGVLAVNHRSHIDLPALAACLRGNVCGVYKRALGKVPLLGQALWLSQSVALDRDDARDSRRQMGVAAGRLKSGRNILVFPEGSRSTRGSLLPFKKGAAVMALEQQADLIPVTIVGTDVLYPPNQLMIHPGDVLVVIHPRIRTTGRDVSERNIVTQELQAAIASAFSPGAPDSRKLRGAVRVA